MRLTTRVSAFFLIALAVVLTGFSGALYLLARNYLVRQLDDRLVNALDTLEASVDIEPGGTGMGARRPPHDLGSRSRADGRAVGCPRRE